MNRSLLSEHSVLFIAIIVALVALVAAFTLYIHESMEETTPPVNDQTLSFTNPTFAWTYDSFTEEEIPRTRISLTATSSNGTEQTKEIATIQGSCNDYVSPDANVYANSTMIICYYAGLGHYYKVVEAEGSYLVQEKTSEEARPDYNPPIEEFETIAVFRKS